MSRFSDIVDHAKTRVQEQTVEEVKARLDGGEGLALIDVREDREWVTAHATGASHISKGVLERDIEKAVPDTSTPIVLYCGGGSRSALAAESLQRMGYTQVVSMIGGFGGWKSAGYPVSAGGE
jgi:rhodanese-related sulfurtransferase